MLEAIYIKILRVAILYTIGTNVSSSVLHVLLQVLAQPVQSLLQHCRLAHIGEADVARKVLVAAKAVRPWRQQHLALVNEVGAKGLVVHRPARRRMAELDKGHGAAARPNPPAMSGGVLHHKILDQHAVATRQVQVAPQQRGLYRRRQGVGGDLVVDLRDADGGEVAAARARRDDALVGRGHPSDADARQRERLGHGPRHQRPLVAKRGNRRRGIVSVVEQGPVHLVTKQQDASRLGHRYNVPQYRLGYHGTCWVVGVVDDDHLHTRLVQQEY